MKLIKKIFFLTIIILLSINNLKAEDKVAYLDIDFILTNTIAGNYFQKTSIKKRRLKLTNLKLKMKNLEIMKKKFQLRKIQFLLKKLKKK